MFLPLVTSLAFGFAPSDTVWIGVEPNRVFELRSTQHSTMLQQQYWQDFLLEQPTWDAKFDPLTGLPFRMWGRGIEVDTSSPSGLERDVLSLLQKHQLIPFKTSNLSLESLGYDENTNRWYVGFEQLITLRNPVWNEV